MFVYSSDRPNLSADATEDIQPGEIVAISGTGAALCQGSDDFGGVALGVRSGEWVADDDEDWSANYSDFVYTAADDHPMPVGGDEDGARLRVYTAKDNGTDPAADISGWDVVGIPAAGTLTTPNDSHYGRLVEEGYTDGAGTPTTYSRANGNFLPIGRAIPTGAAPKNAFDELVHVTVDKSL